MAKQETSSIYEWPKGQGGLIDRIEIVHQKNGRPVAYIHADETPTRLGERQQARSMIRLKGWGTLSDFRNEQFVLRVNGFADDAALLGSLRETGFIRGAAKTTEQAAEKEKPQGLVDRIRTNSLRASGIFYSLGNAVYLASGILRNRERGEKNYGQIRSALAWSTGDALVATIGGKDDGRQLTSLLTKLKKHYQTEGIDIPITAAIHSETSDKNRTVGSRIYDFVHTYLNQIKCASEVIAAREYFKAGKEQGNIWKQRTAVIFGAGFLASLLIPEKKIDPEKYEQASGLERLWMKIRSNPLSVGGFSGYSNTAFTTYGAFDEGRRLREPMKYPTLPHKTTGVITPPSKYYKLDYAAPAVMFFGNGLYAASKKTTGGDIRTDAFVRDVYSIASQILNKLPESEREKALDSTARFLGERPEVRGTQSEIRDKLIAAMTIQRQNPWFENIPNPAKAIDPVHGPAADISAAPATSLVDAASLEHQAKGVAAANDATYQMAAGGR